jgi:ABC-type multidrug transport system fused ATPase/permease subunit
MNLGKYFFGIREERFDKCSEESKNRQLFIYNILAAMLMMLTLLLFLSGLIYGLVLFQNWAISIFLGFFLAGITFNLILLVLFLNLNSGYSELNDTALNMDTFFKEHHSDNLIHETDEKLQAHVQDIKMQLREKHITPEYGRFHFSNILKSAIKVGLLLMLSIIVANALEIWIFRDKINQSVAEIRQTALIKARAAENSSLTTASDKTQYAKWVLEMSQPEPESPNFIHCKSITLTLDILQFSLGDFKILLDVLVAFLFLIPFFLIQKSKEFKGGDYLKEVCLENISTSYYFYLISQREYQRIIDWNEQNFNVNETK